MNIKARRGEFVPEISGKESKGWPKTRKRGSRWSPSDLARDRSRCRNPRDLGSTSGLDLLSERRVRTYVYSGGVDPERLGRARISPARWRRFSTGFATMTRRNCRVRWAVLAVVSAGLLALPMANACAGRGGGHGGGGHGGGGHGGGGHGYRAPRVSAPRGGYKAPRMPRVKSPARVNSARTHSHTTQPHAVANNSASHSNHAQSHANNTGNPGVGTAATPRRGAVANVTLGNTAGSVNRGNASGTRTAAAGRINPTTTAMAGATQASPTGLGGNIYTYGYGSGARPYRAYGYGSGYRNRYYGRRYGYGRSQGYNRGIVARLRSVDAARADRSRLSGPSRSGDACGCDGHPAALAPIDDLQRRGLRTRHEQPPGNGNGNGRGDGPAAVLGGGGAGRMPQAQSDARMSHALRTLQGVNMQLGSQGGFTMGMRGLGARDAGGPGAERRPFDPLSETASRLFFGGFERLGNQVPVLGDLDQVDAVLDLDLGLEGVATDPARAGDIADLAALRHVRGR